MRMPIIAGAFLFAWSASAPAAWHKASSPHFVIYADAKPEKLRAYAEKLEKFDQGVVTRARWMIIRSATRVTRPALRRSPKMTRRMERMRPAHRLTDRATAA